MAKECYHDWVPVVGADGLLCRGCGRVWARTSATEAEIMIALAEKAARSAPRSATQKPRKKTRKGGSPVVQPPNEPNGNRAVAVPQRADATQEIIDELRQSLLEARQQVKTLMNTVTKQTSTIRQQHGELLDMRIAAREQQAIADANRPRTMRLFEIANPNLLRAAQDELAEWEARRKERMARNRLMRDGWRVSVNGDVGSHEQPVDKYIERNGRYSLYHSTPDPM